MFEDMEMIKHVQFPCVIPEQDLFDSNLTLEQCRDFGNGHFSTILMQEQDS